MTHFLHRHFQKAANYGLWLYIIQNYNTWLHLGETLHAHGGVPQLGPAGGRALGEDGVQRRDVARGDHVAPRSRAPGDAEGEACVRGPVDDPAMIRY